MFKKFILKHDVFGHKVQISYDSKNKTHSTTLGGILSLFVTGSLFSLILFKIMVMVTRNNNSITSYSSAFDVDEGKGIDIKQLEMTNYHVIRKQSGLPGDDSISLTDETSRYMDIHYSLEKIDWSKPHKERFEH